MLYPQRRQRDRPISWQDGQCFVTVTDWKSNNTPGSNDLPPHAYEKTARFVYNKRNFTAGAFTPTSKSTFYAGGFYKTAYEPFYNDLVEQRYWISKNNDAISWDMDTIYLKGVLTQIITYSDNPPHAAAHWSLITCAIGASITQADYDAWHAAGFTLTTTDIIGKKPIVTIQYDKAVGYKIAVYALLPATPLLLCYERVLSDYDWAAAFNFIIVGFKTDAKTLVYWDQLYPTGGGIYQLLFNASYTSETRTQLGSTSFPVYDETNTLQNDNPNPGDVQATKNVTSSSPGNTIVDCFFDKDDFTVIYKRHTYSWSESYNHDEINSTTNKAITHSETHTFYAAAIDWQTHTVTIDADAIFNEAATTNSSVTNAAGGYSGSAASTYGLETKLLYAHHDKSLYVFRTNWFTSNIAYSGDTATTTKTEQFKFIVKQNGVSTTLAQFDNSSSTTSNAGNPVSPGNYSNNSSSYPFESYLYKKVRRSAFDGKLMACCFDLSNSDIGTDLSFRARLGTLIYKSANEYQLLDYRLDNDYPSERVYPLSVTSL